MKKNYSNKAIDRLGIRIANMNDIDNVPIDDMNMLQDFRRSYKEPLARVFTRLLELVKFVDKNAIVTYRIKRINTIIRKLQRYSEKENGPMCLSRMWDIAGCRCILSNNDIQLIYQIRDLILQEFGDCKIYDHIEKPKSDGYRSLHMYVTEATSGKKIEIQIRNLEQHNWATLVEIVDLLYSTKIKEGNAETGLYDFLRLYSRRNQLDYNEKESLIRLEAKYRIFKRMSDVFSSNYLNIRQQWNDNKGLGNYYVIEADHHFKSDISSYNHFDEAENDYYDRYLNNRESNIVLTFIKNARFEQISTAYSNYILTVHSFFDDYMILIQDVILESIKCDSFWTLERALRYYCKNVLIYIRNLQNEQVELFKCLNKSGLTNKKAKDWKTYLVGEIKKWNNLTKKFLKQLIAANYSKKKIYRNLIAFRLERLASKISK